MTTDPKPTKNARFADWLFGWYEDIMHTLGGMCLMMVIYIVARKFELFGPIPFLEESSNWIMDHRSEIGIVVGIGIALGAVALVIGIKQARKQ